MKGVESLLRSGVEDTIQMVRLIINILVLLFGLIFDILKMISVGDYSSWTAPGLWSFFLVNIFLIMYGIIKGKEHENQTVNEVITISRRLILLCGIVFGICSVAILMMCLL